MLNQVKQRLPGGRYYKSLSVPIDRDNPLEIALKRYIKNRFVYGAKRGLYVLYNEYIKLFQMKEEPMFLNFENIVIPKPISSSFEEIWFFTMEVTDFIIFNLVENKLLREAVTNEGPYEYGNVKIENEDVVIDCGANMGLFSAFASQKNAVVYAFEPGNLVIENYLSKTAKKNPNIQICNYALSDKRQELNLVINNNAGTNYLEVLKQTNKQTNKQKVQCINLDDFVSENKLKRVDFIKADIEGAERYMLMGAKNVLKEFAPKIAICTYHLPDDPKILHDLILDANPNYIIEENWAKMYAHVPK